MLSCVYPRVVRKELLLTFEVVENVVRLNETRADGIVKKGAYCCLEKSRLSGDSLRNVILQRSDFS